MPKQNTDAAIGEIVDLCETFPHWVSEAVRKLIRDDNFEKSSDELASFSQLEAQIDEGFVEAEHPRIIAKEIPQYSDDSEIVLWKGIDEVRNVNAIRPDQKLLIGKRLTLIYGENGSGKSGYARIIKNAFGAKGVEEILPNVYEDPSPPKSANFNFMIRGVDVQLVWQEKKLPELPSTCFLVFDKKSAEVLLGRNNQIPISPLLVRLLDDLGTLMMQVKTILMDRANNLLIGIDTLNDLCNNSTSGAKISAMTSETDIESLVNALAMTPDDEIELRECHSKLAELGRPITERLRVLGTKKTRLTQVFDHVKKVEDALDQDQINRLQAIPSQLAELTEMERATSGALLSIEMQGVGGQLWKTLVLSAEEFSRKEAYPNQEFPVGPPDGKCVLCQQPLDQPASVRLRDFFEFASGSLASKIREVEVERTSIMNNIIAITSNVPLSVSSTLDPTSSITENRLISFQSANQTRATAIQVANGNGDWSKAFPNRDSLTAVVSEEIIEVEKAIVKMKEPSNIDKEIESLKLRIFDLESRQASLKSVDRIRNRYATLIRSSRLRKLSDSISTLKVSRCSKKVETLLVTDEFRERLNEELRRIGTPRIRSSINQRSDHGTVYHEASLNSLQPAKLNAVFSEGESNALALSMFFAELSLLQDGVGIVFDDPVSSLDHVIRKKVASRIIEEAALRQVIVLTHDLVFWSELFQEADSKTIEPLCQTVIAFESSVGLIQDGAPWDGMKVNQRLNVLDTLRAQAKDASDHADIKSFKLIQLDFYNKLRSTWERAVEEVLFGSVVLRRQSEVKTQTLPREVAIDDESIKQVTDGMTICSVRITAHDHAAAENSPLPTLEDMSSDLKLIRSFVASQKQKKTDAKKRRGVE